MKIAKENTVNDVELEDMIDSDMIIRCCLCEKEIRWGDSCNPWPVVDDDDSRCCHMCNANKVLPARLRKMALAWRGDQ